MKHLILILTALLSTAAHAQEITFSYEQGDSAWKFLTEKCSCSTMTRSGAER